jgi:flagellar hook assembly protein FlgD
LEQLYNTNDNLKTLITAQNALLPTLSANLIGKQVTLIDGSAGKITGVSFDGTNTKLVLDNNNLVSFSDIKKISS